MWWWFTLGCSGAPVVAPPTDAPASAEAPAEATSYAVTGVVLRWKEDGALVVSHDEIPGFMAAMTMPFQVDDPSLRERVQPGDLIAATLVLDGQTRLTEVRVTGKEAAPAPLALRPADDQVPVGTRFPRTLVPLTSGEVLALGEGQVGAVVVGFIYTRCPIPEFCPLTMAKLAGLQAKLPADARLVAISLDPAFDSLGVLAEYGATYGATPGRFDLGRLSPELLFATARRAGLRVTGKGVELEHAVMLLVLTPGGTLSARFDDNAWTSDQVLAALKAP